MGEATRFKDMNIRYLILCLTTRCNLECSYCYNGGGRNERLDMPEAVIEKALEIAGEGMGPLHIQLTGGEPCLAPGLIAFTLKTARHIQRPLTIGIQTNGTRIDAKLASILKDHHVQTGVSLDGPPDIQEALRGSAAETFRGLKTLDDCGAPFRITTVVTRRNVESLDKLVWLLAGYRMARGIGLDLLVSKGNALTHGNVSPATPEALENGATRMIRALGMIWKTRRYPFHFREWDLILGMEKHDQKARPFCHAALGESMAVAPDGRIFPCGQTMNDPFFSAGSVYDPVMKILKKPAMFILKQNDCADCPLNGGCPGECPGRIHYNGKTGGWQNNDLICRLYRTISKHMLKDSHAGVIENEKNRMKQE